MGSVNKVFLVGNLGRDAEQRHTTTGRAVSNFTLATTDAWTDKASGQRQERTEWHRVVVWGRQAESLQPYLTKGKQICVEGRLQTREWNDRTATSGTPRKSRQTASRCSAVAETPGAVAGGTWRQTVDRTRPPAARRS